ncbi:hypothetical protein CFP56_014114 [Quercus suber]|uniref:Dehydrin n=1 Tax=Quercus suber TaxID=58331 RepID=A0AAW0KSE2_QUESU
MGTQFSSLTNMASGNPVQLTDEHGHPMDLTGVATTKIHDEPDRETTGGTFASTCVGVDGAKEHDQLASSEDDGQGEIEGQGGEVRRRKKEGLKEKIKEKLTGGKSEEQSQTESFTSTATTTICLYPLVPPALVLNLNFFFLEKMLNLNLRIKV